MASTSWEDCVQRARALAAEAGSLVGVGLGVDETWLGSAVRWLGEVAPSWEAMTGSTPDARSYRRLWASPSLEAWLICWPSDGHLQLHDHGGAAGAFEVVEGALHERSLSGRLLPDGRLRVGGAEIRDRTVGAGGSVAFDGGYVHDVRNPSGPAATSVHVYGAARRPMSFYRLDGGLIRSVDLDVSRSLVETEVAAERDVMLASRRVAST